MTIIDKNKNCIMWDDNNVYYIKPHLIDGLKVRGNQKVHLDQVEYYELYRIDEETKNEILNHHHKFKKLALRKDIHNCLLETFKKEKCYEIKEKYKLNFLEYYLFGYIRMVTPIFN